MPTSISNWNCLFYSKRKRPTGSNTSPLNFHSTATNLCDCIYHVAWYLSVSVRRDAVFIIINTESDS